MTDAPESSPAEHRLDLGHRLRPDDQLRAVWLPVSARVCCATSTPRLEEASYMCGEGVLPTMRRVHRAPLLRSALLSSLLFIIILAAGEFSVPSILGASSSYTCLSRSTSTTPSTATRRIIRRAGAICTMMVLDQPHRVLSTGAVVRDSRRFVTVTGRGFGLAPDRPGRWRFRRGRCLPRRLRLVTVVLPYSSLLFIVFTQFRTGDLSELHFTLRNVRDVLKRPGVQSAVWNTIKISIAVPVACVLFGAGRSSTAPTGCACPAGGLANYIATAPTGHQRHRLRHGRPRRLHPDHPVRHDRAHRPRADRPLRLARGTDHRQRLRPAGRLAGGGGHDERRGAAAGAPHDRRRRCSGRR